MYLCLDVLTRLWAPILCHTTEEVNDFMHFDDESIHLSSFASVDLDVDANRLVEQMGKLLAVRKDVLKALEIARADGLIKKSLEASIRLFVSDEIRALFEEIVPNPAQWLIVSGVEFVEEPLTAFDVCGVEVEKAKGHVCPRCWNYTESEHEDGLCDRCAQILNLE